MGKLQKCHRKMAILEKLMFLLPYGAADSFRNFKNARKMALVWLVDVSAGVRAAVPVDILSRKQCLKKWYFWVSRCFLLPFEAFLCSKDAAWVSVTATFWRNKKNMADLTCKISSDSLSPCHQRKE